MTTMGVDEVSTSKMLSALPSGDIASILVTFGVAFTVEYFQNLFTSNRLTKMNSFYLVYCTLLGLLCTKVFALQ